MRKIPLDDKLWMQAEDPCAETSIRNLIRQFEECPDTSRDSEVFAELCERICESNTLYPAFYLVFPYLADLVARQPSEQARELWEWMGSWLSEGEQTYAFRMPGEVMEVYQESLIFAKKAVLDFISQYDFASCKDSVGYLLGAPFAFAKPEFGVLSVMYDTEIQKEISCPGGHMDLYTVQREGITDSRGRRVSFREIDWEELRGLLDTMPVCHPNPWTGLIPLFASAKEGNEKQMAAAACQKGIREDSPHMVAAFLYTYLLENLSQCQEEVQFAQLCRRMFDKISCPECGMQFTFLREWKDFY